MPHCIIEYSKDIDIEPSVLIDQVFKSALNTKLFEEHHIKTRTLVFDHYQKGALKEKFIHVSAKILSGRTLKQRSILSQSILDGLVNLGLNSVTITVEVIEMERGSYTKKVL
jgi:5-carboxymethyl-2-hydroxymuconate isomerase